MTKKNEEIKEITEETKMETENNTQPLFVVATGDMPSTKSVRSSKYDSLLDLTEGQYATFECDSDKRANIIRTTLFGWSKRKDVKVKTSFDKTNRKLYVRVVNNKATKEGE